MQNKVQQALREGFTEPVRDTLWGHIYMTPEMEEITRTPVFMRLHRIAQLGPASLRYPGATHTRAAHSLGVYHLARRLLTNLCGRGAAQWLSVEGLRSMLCAALLHDAGHFPYTHSLKELPLVSHEELSGRLIASDPLRRSILRAGGDPDFTAAIVDNKLDAKDDKELLFYRKLLSGCLDPDKLDYLNRDARFCGVPYGAQDIDFILSILFPHPQRGVDIDSRGITSVESLLFSKYLMYRSVYWHHSVRCATSMVKKALLAGLESGEIIAKELYNLDDQGLFSLFDGKKNPLFALGGKVRQGQLFSLIAEFTFDEKFHQALNDIHKRSLYEKEFAAAFGSETGCSIDWRDLIIDVPEPFSFESDLFIRDENRHFDDSSSFFKKGTVLAFIKTLRKVRIFAAQSVLPCKRDISVLSKLSANIFKSFLP
jgi:HD superfamily phosphohydrolase